MAADQVMLHWVDYIVFALMLAISLGIGVYHSQTGDKQKTTSEYLLGNRKMGLIPVTVSMMVSYISTISLLGYPAEIYAYGGQYWIGCFGIGLGSILASYVFVPLFYNLKITSVNEYLEMRYESKTVKYLGSFCVIWMQLFYCGNVYYGPSTAIEAVSGFPVWASILISSIVSVIYTSIGGFKAVIWTDVFQSFIMFLGMIVVAVWGIVAVNGFGSVFRLGYEWGRLDIFDFDPDPTKRINIYGALFGNALTFLGVYGYSQTGLQRYSSLPTLKQAQRCVLGTIPGAIGLKTICCFAGLVMFAYYTSLGCDPLRGGKLTNPNQVLPYFVVDVMKIPAIPGLFMACLAAASLSSASSALNSSAANLWADVLSNFFPNIRESKRALILKIIVIIFGIISTLLGFAISSIGGTVIQIIATFTSIVGGPAASLYYMGAFVPWVNWIGATAGSFVGFAFGMWITFGSYSVGKNWVPLPTTTANCSTLDVAANVTQIAMTTFATDSLPTSIPQITGYKRMYLRSFLWMREAVCGVVIFVAIVVSFITGYRKPSTIEKRFMHPIVSRFCTLAPSKEDKETELKDDMLKDGAIDDIYYEKLNQKQDMHGSDMNEDGANEKLVLEKKDGSTTDVTAV